MNINFIVGMVVIFSGAAGLLKVIGNVLNTKFNLTLTQHIVLGLALSIIVVAIPPILIFYKNQSDAHATENRVEKLGELAIPVIMILSCYCLIIIFFEIFN